MVKIEAKVAEFLKEPNLATFATLRKTGVPHLTYLWFVFDGKDFLVSTTKDRLKTRHLQRDPRASIAIVDSKNQYRWVVAEGKVEISDDSDYSFLEKLMTNWEGPERGKAYAERERQNKVQRVILRLEPERLSSRGI